MNVTSAERNAPTWIGRDAPVISAYMRPINLERGDVMELTFTTPGRPPKTVTTPPLSNNSAVQFVGLSRPRPPGGWPRGAYVADFKIWRAGKPVLERKVATTL